MLLEKIVEAHFFILNFNCLFFQESNLIVPLSLWMRLFFLNKYIVSELDIFSAVGSSLSFLIHVFQA